MNLARENTEGLDYEQLSSCISSGDTAEQVRTERGIANSNGVSSTPTVFVNGDKVSGNSYAAIKTAIDSELQN
jgi:protein-disulfide isomerase